MEFPFSIDEARKLSYYPKYSNAICKTLNRNIKARAEKGFSDATVIFSGINDEMLFARVGSLYRDEGYSWNAIPRETGGFTITLGWEVK